MMSENPRFARFSVGEWSYGEPEVVYWDTGANLTIGRFCSIAPGVTILLGGEHRYEWITTYPFPLVFSEARALPGYPHTKGDVTIGSDVWIGRDALILSGVSVGDGAVIAARSVVVRDVEPYAIVGGNPARRIRFRFPPQTIDALESIAWWNWPFDKIRDAWPLLSSSNTSAFIQKYARA